MSFAERSFELMRELQKAENIPPYNDEIVRKVAMEINAHVKERDDIMDTPQCREGDSSYVANAHLHHQAVLRNRNERLNRIRPIRYTSGSLLPADIAANLGPAEQDFFAEYAELVGSYAEALNLDLATDLRPPKPDWICVRSLQDFDESVQTEYGEIWLKENQEVFVKRSDVEHLIQMGLLKHIVDV